MRRHVVVPGLVVAVVTIVSGQPGPTLRLDRTQVTAGETVTATVRAPAGSTIAVRTDAPGVAPQTVAATGGDQAVRLGPFMRDGDYRVTASAGGAESTAQLRVSFPRETSSTPVGRDAAGASGSPGAPGTPYADAASALVDALNGARTAVSRMPDREPTIAETKLAMDALQRQLADIRRAADETDEAFDAVRRQLAKDEDLSREAKDDFARLEREINQNLAEQARQVREFGRDAEQPPVDSCAAAISAASVLQGQRATMQAMRGGVSDLAAGHARRASGASAANAAAWAAIKTKIEDLVRTGQAGSYAEAERSIGRATGTSGLGGYTSRQCDKFTGEWSGTTHVEALEKGQPFYGLSNDWSAQVEVVAARLDGAAANVDRPIRGTVSGSGSRFKVVNQLRTLYAGRPAQSIEFLTADPSAAQQSNATFVAAIEGFIRGRQMTLKVRPGGVDYAGRVTGKLAAVVIPMGSPVPLVQTFDVVFQGGNWQLSRAIGPNGIPERPFTMTEGSGKRIVRESYPRTLTSAGARGQFTINIQLCAGCDQQ
ncbi:MAG: hypothetical protein AB7Q29_09620 [Vicinamibacterales bacterium]